MQFLILRMKRTTVFISLHMHISENILPFYAPTLHCISPQPQDTLPKANVQWNIIWVYLHNFHTSTIKQKFGRKGVHWRKYILKQFQTKFDALSYVFVLHCRWKYIETPHCSKLTKIQGCIEFSCFCFPPPLPLIFFPVMCRVIYTVFKSKWQIVNLCSSKTTSLKAFKCW